MNESHHTTHICKNCQTEYKGNFCQHCGQSSDTHEINAHFLWHDIQHGLFHFDKGLFYSIRKLAIGPGKAIKEYINGQRVKHFKPISFLFLMATLYGLFVHYISHDTSPILDNLKLNINNDKSTFLNFIRWLDSHYAFYMIILLPFSSLASYLAFRKQHYNYFQHLVVQAYLVGFEMILKTIISAIALLIGQQISLISFVLISIFKLWAFVQLFDYLKTRNIIWRLLLMYILLGLLILILFIGFLFFTALKT